MLNSTLLKQHYAMQEYRRQMLLRAYAYYMEQNKYAPNNPAGESCQDENEKDKITKIEQNKISDSATQVKEIQKIFPNPEINVDDARTIDNVISCYNRLKNDSTKSEFTTHGDFIDTMDDWIDEKNT